MTAAPDQASAANVQAEAIVTKAGEWAAERIREAGELAAMRILKEAQQAHAETAVVAQRAKWAMSAALVAAVSTMGAIWVG